MRPIKKIILLLTVLFSTSQLVGCGTPFAKLTDEDRSSLSNLKNVRVLYYGDTYPSIHTAAGVLAGEMTLGLSAFSEDWTAGQKMMKKYNIPNPMITMRDSLLRKIKKPTNIKKFVGNSKPSDIKQRKIEQLKAKYKNGVVLQVFPGQFQIWYYPASWGRYHMRFNAWAQMTRLNDGKVLWKASCNATQKNKKNRPSMKDLVADNSTVLKTWVGNATKQCSDQLAENFLSRT